MQGRAEVTTALGSTGESNYTVPRPTSHHLTTGGPAKSPSPPAGKGGEKQDPHTGFLWRLNKIIHATCFLLV